MQLVPCTNLQVHGERIGRSQLKCGHLSSGELEIVDLSVLLDAGRCDGLGERDETLGTLLAYFVILDNARLTIWRDHLIKI
jgi:hypothetical protein